MQITDTWNINLNNGWNNSLKVQFERDYFRQLSSFLESRWSAGAKVIPDKRQIFSAFKLTDFQDVKVVIIGQDPYPREEDAIGIAFGVPRGGPVTRTLKNILDEVESSLNFEDPQNPAFIDRTDVTLKGWAKQGVLLLNSCLTTESEMSGCHQNKGWETFVDNVILSLRSRVNKPTVFMLWGTQAQKRIEKILSLGGVQNSIILESAHPSPLSYNQGPIDKRFRGCRHFTLANQYLISKKLKPIDWTITGG